VIEPEQAAKLTRRKLQNPDTQLLSAMREVSSLRASGKRTSGPTADPIRDAGFLGPRRFGTHSRRSISDGVSGAALIRTTNLLEGEIA
jgi:hypothetical protein